MLRPKLPAVGDKVTLFGIEAWVTNVEPASDWMYSIELSSVSAIGAAEMWTVEIPTDFRTTDGVQVTNNNAIYVDVTDDSERECGLCGEPLGNPMTSEWGEFIQDGEHVLAHASCGLDNELPLA